jgi:hypothetical protein
MNLYDKFQALMTAAAFAEEGDFRTARELFEEAKLEALKPGATSTRTVGGTIPGTLATGHSE